MIVVGDGLLALSISETADILGFSHSIISKVYREHPVSSPAILLCPLPATRHFCLENYSSLNTPHVEPRIRWVTDGCGTCQPRTGKLTLQFV